MKPRPKFTDVSRSLLRSTLLDAASDLMREYAWSDISMAAIAARAGVSRQTLYNEFGSREELTQAFALREASSFLSATTEALRAHADDPERAVERALERFLRDAEDHPMVRAIVGREPGADELFALFTTRGGPIIALASELLARTFREHWRTREDADVRAAAEVLVRLAISHASLPTAAPKRAARSMAALLAPSLRALLEP